MRHFLSILFFLIITAGQSEAVQATKLIKETGFCKISNVTSSNSETAFESGILDEQETNDIESPEFCCISSISLISPFQHATKTHVLIIVSNFSETLNQLFIDLPPPSFS